jgi:hypothetical protein
MPAFRHLLLILVALWLPVQAASALAMPFCRHAGAQTEAMADMPAHCHQGAEAAGAATTGTASCDQCEMCHLATAGYLPVASVQTFVEAARVLVFRVEPASPSHIGDPPQQPPRRTN